MLLPRAPVRRRIRATQVCNRCKRRKIKCDKNKPCSNCVKMNYPCSYESNWAPGPEPQLNGDSVSHDALVATQLLESQNSVSSIAQNELDHKTIIPNLKNPWSASAIEEMVLMPQSTYEQLLPLLLQTPMHLVLQVTVAPVILGDSGQKALNSNIGEIKGTLHDPKFPGVLPSLMSSRSLSFGTHIIKLVKNDFVGVNPFMNRDEHLTLSAPFTKSDPSAGTVWEHYGVYSWKTLQAKDVWLSLILKFTAEESEKANSEESDTNNQEGFRQPCPSRKGSPEVKYENRSSGGFSDSPQRLISPTNTLGLVLYDGNVQFDLNAVEQLRLMLPNKRVVWTLVKRYFQSLYAFCPALDELDFREAITNVIGPESYEEVDVVLNVTSKLDFIQLATLLVMLRFSFVSLFSNRESVNEAVIRSNDPIHNELKYLLTHPIDVNVIEICENCLHQFLHRSKVTVPLFLLALLLGGYRFHAPEVAYGEEGDNLPNFNSLLLNMGYSLGFNRDPNNFPGQLDGRKTNFIRKAWFFVCINDVYEGYRYGNPTSTNLNFFDTEYPSVGNGTENVYDKESDRAVTKLMNISDMLIDGAMKQMVDLSLNVRKPVYLSYFTSLLNMLETCFATAFGSLKDYLRPLETYNSAYSYGKLMKSFILLSLHVFSVTVLMHLTEYYKAKQNSQLFYFYTKKMLFIVANEIMAVVPAFVTKFEILFGEGICLFMNPMMIDAIFRVNEIFIANILRCNNYIYYRTKSTDHELRMANDPDYFGHFQRVCDLVVLLQRFCKLCVVVESIMSNRYYMAWKVLKSHQQFVSAMAKPEFYEYVGINPEVSSTEGPHNFTTSQLQELIDILKKALSFVEKQVSENSEELSLEKVWGKPTKVEIPIIINEHTKGEENSTPATPTPHVTSAETPQGMQVPKSTFDETAEILPEVPLDIGDLNKILDWHLVGMDDVHAFNNYEVDTLWQQMSSQRLQKHEQLERAAWQGYFEN